MEQLTELLKAEWQQLTESEGPLVETIRISRNQLSNIRERKEAIKNLLEVMGVSGDSIQVNSRSLDMGHVPASIPDYVIQVGEWLDEVESKTFTTRDFVDWLIKRTHREDYSRDWVRHAFRNLLEEKRIELITPGKGQTPATYKKKPVALRQRRPATNLPPKDFGGPPSNG